MKKIVFLITIIILVAIVFIYNKTNCDYVLMDGVQYEVEIYNVNSIYSFSLFNNRKEELKKWKNNNLILSIACLEGASFIQDLSDQEMDNLFEIPSKNLNRALRDNAAKYLENAKNNFGGLSLDTSVKITKVVSAKSNGINYIIVHTEKIINTAPINSTIIMIEKDRSWKCMSGKRDPNGKLVHSLDRVSKECTRMLKSGETNFRKHIFLSLE